MDLSNTLAPLAPLALEATKFALNPSSANELATETSANSIRAVRLRVSKEPTINRGPAHVAAASLGHLAILDLILEPPRHYHHESQKVDPNVVVIWRHTSSSSCEESTFQKTKHLLEAKAEPDLSPKNGTIALEETARHSDIDIVEVLLSFQANFIYNI